MSLMISDALLSSVAYVVNTTFAWRRRFTAAARVATLPANSMTYTRKMVESNTGAQFRVE